MLKAIHTELIAYANRPWARRIFAWSSVAIFVGSFVLWTALGFGSKSGTGAGAQVIFFLSLAVAIPAIIVFNLVLALAWSAIQITRRSLTN